MLRCPIPLTTNIIMQYTASIMIVTQIFVQCQVILCNFVGGKNAMLTAERRRSMLQTLQREGKVLASELSKTLQVSEDTIRRDLNDLAAAGELQRVHGGTLPRLLAPATFIERQQARRPPSPRPPSGSSNRIRSSFWMGVPQPYK